MLGESLSRAKILNETERINKLQDAKDAKKKKVTGMKDASSERKTLKPCGRKRKQNPVVEKEMIQEIETQGASSSIRCQLKRLYLYNLKFFLLIS